MTAAGGTVWLADVARLPVEGQVRLLELLATGRVSPVGAAALLGLNNSTTLSNRMSKHGVGTR